MRLVRSNSAAINLASIRNSAIRTAVVAASAAAVLLFGQRAHAQGTVGVGSSITPYVGYMVAGKWYDGPVGTSLSTTNATVVGGQIGVPLSKGVSIIGNVAYSSSDLRVGLPIIGGVNIGTNKMWLYDVGLELGGLRRERTGIAPFIQGGVGGVTNDIKNALFSTRATNMVYTGGVGVDLGLARGFAIRAQAKDYVGRFDSQEAVGFRAEGNLAHNWAFSAGVKLAF